MNLLRKKLQNGESITGTNSHLNCKETVEILAAIGFDFIFLDGEHPTAYPKDLYDAVKICRYSGCASLVRLPTDDLTYTKKKYSIWARTRYCSL